MSWCVIVSKQDTIHAHTLDQMILAGDCHGVRVQVDGWTFLARNPNDSGGGRRDENHPATVDQGRVKFLEYIERSHRVQIEFTYDIALVHLGQRETHGIMKAAFRKVTSTVDNDIDRLVCDLVEYGTRITSLDVTTYLSNTYL